MYRDMVFLQPPTRYEVPAYRRTTITGTIHNALGFCTAYEIRNEKQTKKF